jgi:hypothetical protein
MSSGAGDKTKDLGSRPIKRCDSHFCATEGRLITQRVVWIGETLEEIIFWCVVCPRYVCAHCALRQEIDQDVFWNLDDDDEVRRLSLRLGVYPISFQCRHCGEFLGSGEEMLILVNETRS